MDSSWPRIPLDSLNAPCFLLEALEVSSFFIWNLPSTGLSWLWCFPSPPRRHLSSYLSPLLYSRLAFVCLPDYCRSSLFSLPASLFLFSLPWRKKKKKVPPRGNSLRWEFMASESFDPGNLGCSNHLWLEDGRRWTETECWLGREREKVRERKEERQWWWWRGKSGWSSPLVVDALRPDFRHQFHEMPAQVERPWPPLTSGRSQ